MDPGDESGIEAGLQLKEAHGGEVTLVSMGPAGAAEAVRRGLSMGADRGVLISDDSLVGADSLVTARALAVAIQRAPFDLVIAGVESTDGYTGTTPSTLAELLELPQLTFARRLDVADGTVTVERQTPDGYHVVQGPTPALVTVTAGINEPRYASFKGIMAAKKKPFEQLTVADLGLSAEKIAVKQKVVNIGSASERKAGEVIEDDGSGASRIARFLAEAKVV